MEIQFKYASIKTDQFAILDPHITIPANEYSLVGEVQIGNNYEARVIIITVSANYRAHDSLAITLKVTSYFEIDEASWTSLRSGEYIIVPKEFLLHICGLSFGTTRGILFAKTEGTDLNRMILPLTNLTQIVKGDMKIAMPGGE